MSDDDLNIKKFHLSLTDELKAIENRVRHLIDDSHWGEEGRYKELVLMNIIRRHLPKDLQVGTGFVYSKVGEEIKKSKQIDILIVDKNYPLLFSEGSFLIVTPNSVRGIIEVKTTLDPIILRESIEKMNFNSKVISELTEYQFPLFNGIFAYNYKYNKIENPTDNQICSWETSIRLNYSDYADNHFKGTVNHIALNKDIFMKRWDEDTFDYKVLKVYRLEDLAFSYFISNLCLILAKRNKKMNYLKERNIWFPLLEGKGIHEKCSYQLKP